MRFIKLTLRNSGEPIFFNIPAISSFVPSGEGAKIWECGNPGDEFCIEVTESPEEILKKIRKGF